MKQEKSYHEILRSALEKSPLTNKEVAERAGIHSTYLSKLVKPGAVPASDSINESLEIVLRIKDSLLRTSAYRFAIPPELMPIIVDDYCQKHGLIPVSQNSRPPSDRASKHQVLARADRRIRRLDRLFCQKKHAGEIPIDQYPACAECKVEQSKQAAHLQAMKISSSNA